MLCPEPKCCVEGMLAVQLLARMPGEQQIMGQLLQSVWCVGWTCRRFLVPGSSLPQPAILWGVNQQIEISHLTLHRTLSFK